MLPATAVRLFKATKAALNLAARRDHRISNTAAWTHGLGGIAEGAASRNMQRLDDEQVRAVIRAAYALDRAFGLYVEVLATTGARPSQVARLTVDDLQADNGTPRLMMPSSRKGRNRKPGKTPVPITPALAAALQAAAGDREPGAPLLVRTDGTAWQSSFAGDHTYLFAQVAERAGVTCSIYALRHSAIVRSLLANVPIRVISAISDTSTGQIEKGLFLPHRPLR
jgi:integrase